MQSCLKMNISALLGFLAVSTQISAMSQPSGNGSVDINTGHHGGVIKSSQPAYPAKAQLNGIEGWVDVVIKVNEYGKLASATVAKAKPSRVFDESALNSLENWQFQQKFVDGQAVPYQLTQMIEFKLKNYTMGEIAYSGTE